MGCIAYFFVPPGGGYVTLAYGLFQSPYGAFFEIFNGLIGGNIENIFVPTTAIVTIIEIENENNNEYNGSHPQTPRHTFTQHATGAATTGINRICATSVVTW